jgi:Ca2+-binding RTX toxin-like protein
MVRRKIFMVLALAGLLVVMFASAALAAKLGETRGNDKINGGGGRDIIHADRYGGDRDIANGGSGNDVIHADDRDTRDKVNGGPGFDRCYIDSLRELAGKPCEETVGTGNGNGKREARIALRM